MRSVHGVSEADAPTLRGCDCVSLSSVDERVDALRLVAHR